jgi:hypothetical protein
MASEDNVSLLVKQNVDEMLNTIQQSHPGAAVTGLQWSGPDVLGQVVYKMEYTY